VSSPSFTTFEDIELQYQEVIQDLDMTHLDPVMSEMTLHVKTFHALDLKICGGRLKFMIQAYLNGFIGIPVKGAANAGR
jgi:hypothetical protein